MKLSKKVLVLCDEGKLIGSAPNKEKMIDGIKKYFYAKEITLYPIDDKSYEVHNTKGKIDGVIVKESKGRFRFEMSEENTKPVNYTVKATLYFDDGQNKGQSKIKALNAKDAEKLFREKMKKNWPDANKVEILSITKG